MRPLVDLLVNLFLLYLGITNQEGPDVALLLGILYLIGRSASIKTSKSNLAHPILMRALVDFIAILFLLYVGINNLGGPNFGTLLGILYLIGREASINFPKQKKE